MDPAESIRIKDLLPTDLGSDEVREQVAADILRRSILSARMEDLRHLAVIRDVCADVVAGAINQATARERLPASLARMGHSPLDEGGISNPASIRRLNLIVDTQTRMAASVARIDNQTEATIALWPAWELFRFETRQKPRQDWTRRWREAGNYCGWQGALQNRFIALKNSPIWAALGQGAGGFRDTLGNPYPPFAFNSGLDWMEVSAEECKRLGLSTSTAANPPRANLSPGERDILEAVEDIFG